MVFFNWLHLTDLHLGMDGLQDLWPNVEEDLFNDLAFLIKEEVGPLDLVLFTGDLVQRGSTKEFEQANRLLEKFWKKFREMGCEPKLLAVPGNHDLVRPRNSKNPTLINLTKLWNDSVVNETFWNNPKSPQRKLVAKAFANYVEWWQSTSVPKLDFDSRGMLPGDFSATLEKEGIKLGIIGLNSTFLQLIAGDLEGKMALHVRQFNAAGGGHGADWVNEHDLCLLLTHHPPEWLTVEGRDQLNGEIHHPPERFALHLYGHMHEPEFRSFAKGGADAQRRLQGCSLFGMEGWGERRDKERLHGYSLGQVKIEGETAELRLWPRRAVKEQTGGWRIDRDQVFSLPRGQEGTKSMPVTLLRPRPKQSKSSPGTGENGTDKGGLAPSRVESNDSAMPDDFYGQVTPLKLGKPKFINQLPIAVESKRFKNRVKEQKDIVRIFLKNGRLVSIYGHAGVGKTTLACKVLGDLQSAPDCQYDMVHLSKDSTGISLDGIFTNFGKLLMGESKNTVDMAWRDRQQSTTQKVSVLLDHLREGRYVLLLDGLEHLQDLKTFKLTDPDMETFFERALQQASTLQVLVTSRFPLALPLPLKSWERLIPLEQGLPTAYAVDLLRTLDPDGRAGLQEASVEKLEILAKETGGFPIALESVAGLLLSQKRRNQKPLHLDDILQDKKMLASSTEEFVQRVISQLSPEMIRVMEGVALLMEGLVRFERPVTYDALEFLFVPFHIDAKTLRENMDLLIETYFVTFDEVKKTFVLHQIDREYCYSRIPRGSPEDKVTDEHLVPYTRYALHYRAANFYERERKPQAEWRSLDDLVPQLSEFEHRILADDYDAAARLINLIDTNYLSLWGHVRTVQGMRQQLIGKITDRGLEEINVGSLGNAYYNLGQYEQAIDMYQQALGLSRTTSNRAGEGIWLGCLARVYRNRENLREALDYFQQALTISCELGNKREEETNLDNLGLTYADLGEYERALEYGQQALAVALEIKDRRGESAILGNLGNAYYGLGKHEQAVDYHRQALQIAREVGDRRREGIHLGNIGRAYAALGQHKQAIELYERAISIAREVGDRRGEGYRLDFLGRTYADLGQHKRAIELYELARAIANEIGHKRNEGYALNSLGLAYTALGRREQAIEYYQRALALFKALDIEYLVHSVERNIAYARAKQSSSQV